MKIIFKNILMLFSIFLFTQSLAADEQTDLKKHLLSKIDSVVMLVENKTLSKDERNQYVIDLLTPAFDFVLMAKLSLGNAWKSANDQEREKFVELYVKRMQQSYSSKLDAYSDEKVEVTNIEQPKSNRMYISTNLISKDNNLEIIYKFYKPGSRMAGKDAWLIYDVEIMGVSILKTDKAQFKEFLNTKSMADLIDLLASK